MNNPSPLVPQGSNLEQKNAGRARVRLAVFFIISVHVVGLMALLLMPGCRKPEEPEQSGDPNQIVAPALDPTNSVIEPEPMGTMPTQPTADPALAPIAIVPAVQEYTIAKGDNYTTIAKQFGVTVKALSEANPGVDPNRLQIGKKIVIPAPVPPAPISVTPEATPENVYTVKSGDNLTKIAAEYKTTIKAIRAANPQLTSDRIIVGQKLNIPAPTSASAPQ